MVSGFIPGSRASFMMDFVTIAMAIVLPVMTFSILAAKIRKNYGLHRKIQIFLAAILLGAVLLFEVDVRLFGWRHLAEASPYYNNWLFPFLLVHVAFSITTFILWTVTIWSALKKIPDPPMPSPYTVKVHKRLGIAAALTMYITALTGWTFYYMAFLA